MLNKRPHIQLEFKQADGYSLLQRVFISIASLNKFYSHTNGSNSTATEPQTSYFGQIQKKLFLKLINGCFQSPVFYLNSHSYSVDKIELTFYLANDSIGDSSYKHKTSNPERNSKLNKKPSLSNVHLINANLLAQILVEWDLWRPVSVVNSKETTRTAPMSSGRKYSDYNGENIWQHMFKILNKLLEDGNPAQMFHSSLFLKHGILEKLMHFLLDANGENFFLDQESCQALIDIFKHFNTVFNNMPHNGSSASYKAITKQLFSNFSDYLYILHSERNVYIVNQKNEFYFHLSKSLKFIYVYHIYNILYKLFRLIFKHIGKHFVV